MDTIHKIISSGALFLLVIASGIWLSNIGRPYNALIFNVHKLIALAAVIYIAVIVYGQLRNVEMKALLIALAVGAIIAVLMLFISGALMSLGIGSHKAVWLIHTLAAVIAALILGASLYFITTH